MTLDGGIRPSIIALIAAVILLVASSALASYLNIRRDAAQRETIRVQFELLIEQRDMIRLLERRLRTAESKP